MKTGFIFPWMVIVLLTGCATSSGPKLHTGGVSSKKLADMVGSWEIDYKNTDDPQVDLQYLYDITRSQLEQDRMNPDFNPQGNAALRDIRALQGVLKLSQLASDELTHSTVLTITDSDGLVTIKRSHDYSLTCDFLAPVSQLRIGQESCGFDDKGRLVFEALLPQGLTVINRFTLTRDDGTPDDRRLNASLILSSQRFEKPFVLNRVYMPFPPGTGSQYKCKFTLEHKKTCWLGKAAD